MKTITYEDFVRFSPCWLTDDEERNEYAAQLVRYRKMRDKWSAIDILRLDDVIAEDRLWIVLRGELIDAPILHEFACRCAERSLARIDKPDERSVAAIEAKRKWLRGEISDDAMDAARAAACAAARASARSAAYAAARASARSAAWDAELSAAMTSAQYAAWGAARYAARNAAWNAAWDAEFDAAWAAEREWQIVELMRMLEEKE